MALVSIGKPLRGSCFVRYALRPLKYVKTLVCRDVPSFVGIDPGMSGRTLDSREIDPWLVFTDPGMSGRTLFYRNSPEAEATLSTRRNQRDDSIFRDYR